MVAIRSAFILAALSIAAVDGARADIAIGFISALTGPYAWVGEPHLAGTELATPTSTQRAGY